MAGCETNRESEAVLAGRLRRRIGEVVASHPPLSSPVAQTQSVTIPNIGDPLRLTLEVGRGVVWLESRSGQRFEFNAQALEGIAQAAEMLRRVLVTARPRCSLVQALRKAAEAGGYAWDDVRDPKAFLDSIWGPLCG